MNTPLTVAWISDFPVEWLPEPPAQLSHSPRRHPATWAMVLLSEFQKDPSLRIHVIVLRHRVERDFSFERNGTVFHVLKTPVALRVASLFWLDTLRIRRVCQQLRPDLIHAWGMEKGAAAIAARLNYPYVATVQGLYGWYLEKVPLLPYDRFIARLERRYLPCAPVVTTESTFAVGYLQKRYPALRVVQAEHAPNHAFFAVRRQPQTQPVHFISIGTLGYRKGTDLLFKGLDRLAPELTFKLSVITGPDPDFIAWLRSLVSSELWSRVIFKEHLLPEQVAQELEGATMLLLPTRADTSPNAAKEAAVAGVPVIASEVGGIPDYIKPGKNGLLFGPGELTRFVDAIRAGCAHPLFGRGGVDQEILDQARDYLSPEAMARNFLGAYHLALEHENKSA